MQEAMTLEREKFNYTEDYTEDKTENTEDTEDTEGVLSKKAMLVTLSTSCWTGRVTDKITGKEVCENKRADEKAGNFTKAIIEKEHFKPIRSILTEARRYHNEITLSWNDNGQRILPSSLYGDYMATMRSLQTDLEQEISAFEAKYPNLVNDATYWLGDLFDRDAYPEPNEIKSKFSIEIDIAPIPSSDDFRVQISDQEKAKVKQSIARALKEKHAKAMKRVWERVYVVVEKFHQKMVDEKAVFRNSLIDNIKSLVDLLPELNLSNDQELASMTQSLKENIYDYDPNELRKDPEVRKEAADKTRQILDNLQGLY